MANSEYAMLLVQSAKFETEQKAYSEASSEWQYRDNADKPRQS
jgi:hypothetical protein